MPGEIHLHVRRGGTLLMLGETDGAFAWHAVTLSRLQALIERMEATNALDTAIAYTRDDPDCHRPTVVETTFKVITSFGLPIRLASQPITPIP